MVSGSPSLPPTPAEQQRLDEARGRLRDALGGISNLDQLLHSLRVGPKALVTVLPDVQASCADIRGAADELLGVFERYLPSPAAAHALRDWVHPQIRQLEHELVEAMARPMNAKNRLRLEQLVDRASLGLGASRWLIDLLDDALWSPTVRLSLHEMVREASKTPVSAAESAESVAVTLAPALDGAEVLINPRVGMGMVSIAVAWVVSQHPNAVPHIEVELDPARATRLVIRKERGEGVGLMLVRRPLIPAALPCLDAAAALSRASVTRAEDGSRLTLAWRPVD